MKRSWSIALALLVAALLIAPAAAEPTILASVPSTRVFAGGGTPVTNGFFFPGTAFYVEGDFVGTSVEITKGTDIEFINLDEAAIANGHRLVSLKRNKRTRLPLFSSELLKRPGDTDLVVTSHLKPGTYPFYCNVHDAMYGLLTVQ